MRARLAEFGRLVEFGRLAASSSEIRADDERRDTWRGGDG
jgi:hypothetical protein